MSPQNEVQDQNESAQAVEEAPKPNMRYVRMLAEQVYAIIDHADSITADEADELNAINNDVSGHIDKATEQLMKAVKDYLYIADLSNDLGNPTNKSRVLAEIKERFQPIEKRNPETWRGILNGNMGYQPIEKVDTKPALG